MSNYIYNDNFEEQGPEHVKIIYAGEQKKKLPIAFIVCTALIVLAGLMFLVGGIFSFIGGENAKNSAPFVQIVEAPESNTSTDETSPLANKTTSLTNTINNVKDSVVVISSVSNGSAIGSGVIVGTWGPNSTTVNGYYVITNAHVIQGPFTNMYIPVNVVLNDGSSYKAEVCDYNTKSDIAILKIREANKELCVASWANQNSNLLLGEQVFAIGNPLGKLGGTVTIGYISALSREISIGGNTMNLLQFDAAVNKGNSGGGLFNTNGELIGIVCAKMSGEDIEGIGFAIPHTEARDSLFEVILNGYLSGKPTIGADFYTSGSNIVVHRAEENSALKDGDIIKGIIMPGAEYEPATVARLQEIVNSMNIDDTFKLAVERNGTVIYVTVVVYEYTL